MNDVNAIFDQVAELITIVKPCEFESSEWYAQHAKAKQGIEDLVGYLANHNHEELLTERVYNAAIDALISALEKRSTKEEVVSRLRKAVRTM